MLLRLYASFAFVLWELTSTVLAQPAVGPCQLTSSVVSPWATGALVFSHKVSGASVPGEYFANAADILSNTCMNIQAVNNAVHKFSLLNNLEPYRRLDGNFEFYLVWPGCISNGAVTQLNNQNNYIHFVQSSNPAETNAVSNLQILSQTFGVQGTTCGTFGGLRLYSNYYGACSFIIGDGSNQCW